MGLSVTKRESKLQNESFIYKTGVLDYKWDSRVAIHLTIQRKTHDDRKKLRKLEKKSTNILTFERRISILIIDLLLRRMKNENQL